MSRPCKRRWIAAKPPVRAFKPAGVRGHTLEAIHSLIHEIRHRGSQDLSVAVSSSVPPPSITEEFLLPAARYAFRSAIIGHLALHNMLALANDNDLDDRLLAYSRDEFKEWLDRIDQAGSVTR